ncbi:Kinesin light chain 4 (KLC 4) (Kinesin-like protein 8) [Durusdinium trenchii]
MARCLFCPVSRRARLMGGRLMKAAGCLALVASGLCFGTHRHLGLATTKATPRSAQGFGGEELRQVKKVEQQYKTKKGLRSTTDAVRFFEKAASCREKGDLQTAIQHYRKARVAIGKASGKGSKDYARVCNDLAQTYFEVGRHNRAMELLEESRTAFATAVGEEHVEYAGCLQNLARVKLKLNFVAEAEALYKKASKIYAGDLGANHMAYLDSLRSLASLYQSVGQPDMVRPLLLEEQRVKTLAAQLGHRAQ